MNKEEVKSALGVPLGRKFELHAFKQPGEGTHNTAALLP